MRLGIKILILTKLMCIVQAGICPPGFDFSDSSGCTQCLHGQYSYGAGNAGDYDAYQSCADCGGNSYGPWPPSDICVDCPPGTWTNVNAATFCPPCDAGKYWTPSTLNAWGGEPAHCKNCGAGKYGDATGQTVETACKPCGVGKYRDETGGAYEASCTGCPTGKYGTATGLTAAASCIDCGVGKYREATGGTSAESCIGCATGKYGTATGQSVAASCTSCGVGKYRDQTGGAYETSCNICPSNQYMQGIGASQCINCVAGKATSHTNPVQGNTDCTACPLGYYKATADGQACNACSPGTYQTSTGQTFCTSCAGGLYSGVTAATTATVCLQCIPGTYSSISASTCTQCIKGKYNTAAGLSTCTLCVGEQAYAPFTGMTTCYQCSLKREISDIHKTKCFVCVDGEEEDRPNSMCRDCDIGKYSDGTTNRKCVPCRPGTYAVAPKTAVCTKCKACPDSFYRVGCTITQGGGTCVECEKCADAAEVRVDCMNREGHNNASGICRKREFTVRNPYCDIQGSGYFLGGYTFNELFGTSQDNADFQCRGICDGVTNRLTNEMKNESNLIQYKDESFDSGYCKGPYACDVPTCVIYGVSDDSQPTFRLPAACPVIIEDAVTDKLWTVTKQANYKQDPLTVAVQHMRYSVQCQACSTCGEFNTDLVKVWPLMQNYTDWGRGCARECTELSCELGEIFDWTVTDVTRKCKQCSELEDVRLCTSQQQLGFAAADISGNLPKLTFKDCQSKRILQYGIARASYGDCVRCPEVNDACLSQPGLYYATCDVNLNPVCKKCDTRATAFSSYFNGTTSLPLYCQKTLCPEDRTGVTIDVFPHRTCHRQCSKTRCATDRVELPCLLPHDKRCKESISYTDFVSDEVYKKQGYVPAHANVLERVSGLHLFSSFENVLLSVDSIPLQKRRVCVWNTNGITDNDMNPAGVSVQFEEACRPWTRDPSTAYPLLPMQNTVTDTTEFQRRILLNTSAIAMHYLSLWQNVKRIPNVFTGDVFLELELINTSHTALVVFVSPDRLLSNVTSVVRWHVSVYAQQTVGQRDDVLISIDTHDDVQACDECFNLDLACVPPNCARANSMTNTSLACSTAPHNAFRTSQLYTAWQDFCGDKFHVSVPTGKIYVCDQSMQRRVMRQYTSSHTALCALTGQLETACTEESLFSVQMSTAHVMIGSTEVLPGKYCLGFLFSNTSVFCLSAGGVLHTISDARLHPDAFSIQSVVVYRDSLITTVSSVISKITTSYASNISSICASLSLNPSVTTRVLHNTATVFNHTRYPILMLATGNPLYFLSRVDAQTQSTIMLRQYTCGDVLIMTYTFCESVDLPVQLFSGNTPSVETQNTLLHARGGKLLFVTSTQSPSAGTVLMAVLVSSLNVTRKSVALTTEARDIVYPNNGNAHRISGCWISDSVYLIGLEKQEQIWKVTVETTITFTLLPPAKSMFSYSFIALGGALLTRTLTGYSLTSCMSGCFVSTTDTSTYFAFGNDMLTYKRLLPCRDANLPHVNPMDWKQTPTETCAVAEYDRSTYSMQYDLSFKCKQSTGVISMSVTLELGAVMRITTRDTSMLLTANSSQVLSMYAQCVNMNVQYIELFDLFACGGGCALYQVSQMQITGKLRINYVLHTDRRPSNSMIYTQLRSTTYTLSQPKLSTSFDRWTQHSAFTHSMTDFQRIQVNVMRRTKALFALSESAHVALDVLQVVPTLNMQAVPYELPTNMSVLLTLVHIPSDHDLTQLALLDSTVRGNEIFGWKRLHAAAFLRSADVSLRDCVYDLRFVAVDDRFMPRQSSSQIGCRMRMQAEGVKVVSRCHIEVPFAMANSARVVGLILSQQGTCALPPGDSLTVELNPFTSMSECPEHQYLDANTATCASCEVQTVVCRPGFYAAGCEAMLWQSNLVECLPCPIPPHALFRNTSVTCRDWLCEASFYRSDSLCLNCSTSLQTVCFRTPGRMWQPCTDLLNERCADCPLSRLPRNAEWTNTFECAWKCKPSYFNNNGICESCLSLKILKSVLSIQGTRAPGQFYKFRPCTETRQAEFSTCQFQQRLNVTYTGDATEFLNDCPVRCAEYLHAVNTTVLDADNATWKATRCIQCPVSSEPTYVNGSLLPRWAYDMDESCFATCRAAADHYAVDASQDSTGIRCAYCPAGRCAAGQYSATEDGCMSCRNCSSNLLGAFVFEREGLVNDNSSCHEVCAPGYYLADDGVQCLPHTDVQCVPGQFKVNGTARMDARCDECTDCTGYRQVRSCSLTQDAKCESCGSLVWWNSYWNGTECELACRPAYTKLYMPKARCQRCSTCPNGFERVSQPANCSDCRACTPPKPQRSEYISQCAWKCEKYHIFRLDDETGLPQCVYSVAWSTNVPAPPARRQYNISCTKGQKLTDELLCADCLTPSGLNQSQINVVWMWTDVGCAWQCVPGLMHVINATSQQNSCLTRAEYLALVVSRPVHLSPSFRSFTYTTLLLVIVPINMVLLFCCLRFR